MYIPPSSSPVPASYAASQASNSIHIHTAPAKGWSSVIGIVTAICGNILISIALNTQRYAHIRLNRDRDEYEEKQKRRRKRKENGVSYGTQQLEVAEERSEANARPKSEPREYDLHTPAESNETEPLIPSVDTLDTNKSSEEDDNEEEEDDSQQQKSYLKSPIWWLGITLMTFGEAGNFLAYGFAPASIVSPLGVVALVSNCLIAPLFLHERFRWRDGIGVIIAVAGCVTVVLSASDSNPKLDPDKIWHLIARWEFETYLAITVVVIIALMFASNRFGEKTILIDLGLMGLFGGYTALSTKGVASLLSSSIWRVITFPITYLLVAVLVGTAIMQIKYVNRALQRFNATMVIPTQFVLFTLSVIIGSAILYRDFERTTTDQASKFVGGCALTFLGVWCITSGRNDSQDGELGEEDDAINLRDEEGVQPEIRERQRSGDKRPSITISTASKTGSLPQIELDSPELTNQQSVDIAPANAAAIHSQSTSDLPAQTPGNDGSSRPATMHATTSTPILPTSNQAAGLRPKTPLRRGFSEAVPSDSVPKDNATPTTPHRQSQPELLDPNTNTAQRPPARHSVSSLLPGPLTSPLSSSLSAIVADSLRRGVDYPSSAEAIRSRSIRLQRQRSQRNPYATPLKRHSIASGEMAFGEDDEDDDGGARRAAGSPPTSGGGRMRSLSATLGEIMGGGSSSRTKPKPAPRSRNDGEQGSSGAV